SYLVSRDGLPFPGLLREGDQLAVAKPSGHYMQKPPEYFAAAPRFPLEDADDLQQKAQLDALGYHPPTRALGVKGTSRTQTTDLAASDKNQPTDSPVNGTSTLSAPQGGEVSQGVSGMGPGLGGRPGGGLGMSGGG